MQHASVKKGKKQRGKMTLAKLGRFLFSIVRGVIVFGICYVILYPIFVKLSVSLMDEKDLYDATVKYIPNIESTVVIPSKTGLLP